MSDSIVCGVGGSTSAKRAARVARILSSELGLRLVFVRVLGSSDDKVGAVARRLERLSGLTTEFDCGAAWLVGVGHPADRLVAAAVDEAASFIVVGSGGPHSSIFCDTLAEVSRRAPCPVVVVPPDTDARVNGHGDRELAVGAARTNGEGGLGSYGCPMTR